MRRILVVALAAVLLLAASAGAVAPPVGPVTIQVGLFYGSNALPGANLDNNVGSGHRFGYFDANLQFIPLGYTALGKISVVKAQNVYYVGDNYTDTATSSVAVGCYHLQMPNSYSNFESALIAASQVPGGFPAWVDGSYYVRAGAYTTREAAVAAQYAIPGATLAGTSSYAVTVVETGTSNVIFQFDGGTTTSLGIRPGMDDSVKTATWCRGFRYYGSFRYQRQDGGNLTVLNILPLEDYIKGVVPAELGESWPLEALKAQAVCARNYALTHMNNHQKYGFNVCNTVDCQAYTGLNKAGPNTDRSVDETAGVYALYNGELAQTTYYSSDGGATEDARNVWGGSFPYLMGVRDSWEASIESTIPNYRWTVTVTAAQLAEKLRAKGYTECRDVVDFYVSERSATGNVIAFTIVDSTGKKFTLANKVGEQCRIMLGLRSINYTITGGSGDQLSPGSSGSTGGIPGGIPGDTTGGTTGGTPGGTTGGTSGSYFVNGTTTAIPQVSGAYTVDGNGNITPIEGTPYAITGSGTVEQLTPTPGIGGGIPGIPTYGNVGAGSGNGVYTITGAGYGHLVGMSQWGANAMAKQGKTYEEILTFYFTGITLSRY